MLTGDGLVQLIYVCGEIIKDMGRKVTAQPVPPFHLRYLTLPHTHTHTHTHTHAHAHTTARKQPNLDQIKKTLVALIAVVSPSSWLDNRSD